MTPRQRMICALERRQPRDCVPIWELSFHLWAQASGGQGVVVGREFEKLTTAEQEKALHDNARIIASVSRELNFAGLTPPGGYWEVSPGEPAFYWLPEEARWEQLRILIELIGDQILLVPTSGGVMAMPSASEYVEFSYKLYDAPEEIDAKARRCFERGIEQAKRARDCGARCVKSSSDLADNHGPFFNAEQMERFILPYMRDWADFARAQGMYCILHSDGNLNPCLESIADSGIHAIQAIDPVAGMDIQAVKAQVGDRLCLCGNVDCGLLLTGTPKSVYEQTARLLDECKGGGGFVLGASNAVVAQTPLENYRAMLDAWKDHGAYEPA